MSYCSTLFLLCFLVGFACGQTVNPWLLTDRNNPYYLQDPPFTALCNATSWPATFCPTGWTVYTNWTWWEMTVDGYCDYWDLEPDAVTTGTGYGTFYAGTMTTVTPWSAQYTIDAIDLTTQAVGFMACTQAPAGPFAGQGNHRLVTVNCHQVTMCLVNAAP